MWRHTVQRKAAALNLAKVWQCTQLLLLRPMADLSLRSMIWRVDPPWNLHSKFTRTVSFIILKSYIQHSAGQNPYIQRRYHSLLWSLRCQQDCIVMNCVRNCSNPSEKASNSSKQLSAHLTLNLQHCCLYYVGIVCSSSSKNLTHVLHKLICLLFHTLSSKFHWLRENS